MANQLIRRCSIYIGQGTENAYVKHLPPWSLLVKIDPVMDVRRARRPWNTSRRDIVTASRRTGTIITISGEFNEGSVDAALALKAELIDALFDAGDARTIDFCNWLDVEGLQTEIWQECVCTAFEFEVDRSERQQKFSIALETPAIASSLTFTDGETPDAGPYEASIFNGSYVPTVTGDGEPAPDPEPIPEVVAVPVSQKLIENHVFSGEVQVTGASNDDYMQHMVTVGAGYKVTGLQIVGCQSPGSGTSRVCIATAPYDSASTIYRATVGADVGVGTKTAVPNLILSGGVFYLFWDQAGGHAGVNVRVELKSV